MVFPNLLLPSVELLDATVPQREILVLTNMRTYLERIYGNA